MRDKWSALFVGRDTGLLAEYGNAWTGHPAHYSRVAVVSEAALDKANDHIERIERDLRTFKNHCNTLDAELDARDAEIARLRYALNAMVCFFGMDEDSDSKTVFDVARAALTGGEGS